MTNYIKQKIRKFDFKISFMPSRLEKCMSFTLHKNLVFIESCQVFSFPLNNLVKKLDKNDLKHLVKNLILKY